VDSGSEDRQTSSFYSWKYITVMQAQLTTGVESPFTPPPTRQGKKITLIGWIEKNIFCRIIAI